MTIRNFSNSELLSGIKYTSETIAQLFSDSMNAPVGSGIFQALGQASDRKDAWVREALARGMRAEVLALRDDYGIPMVEERNILELAMR